MSNLNKEFNYAYRKRILHLYKKKLIPQNQRVSITRRPDIDFTKFNYGCYTVDPRGSKDADDGFSIYVKEGQLFLVIHIASPTLLMSYDSEIFQTACNNVVTRYPSNTKPIHLLPERIMKCASLSTHRKNGEKKYAMSLFINIDSDFNAGQCELKNTTFKVFPYNKYTYEQASKMLDTNYTYTNVSNVYDVMNIASKIANNMRLKRKTIGKNIQRNASIQYINNIPYLHNDTCSVIIMKSVIEEFAIFANSHIGKLLNQKDTGMFRECNTDLLEQKIDNSSDIMEKIIKTKTHANYTIKPNRHGLVGSNLYSHFTSPIRRSFDCLVHYLLLGQEISSDEIEKHMEKINDVSGYIKKIQRRDYKFRVIQALNTAIVENKNVCIDVKFRSRYKQYFNLHITNVYINNEVFRVSLYYTSRCDDIGKTEDKLTTFNIPITYVCVPCIRNEGLPEIDEYLKQQLM